MLRSRISWVLASLALVGVCLAAPLSNASESVEGESTSRPTNPTRKLALVASDKQAVPGWLRESEPESATSEDTDWRKTTDAVVLLHMFRSDHSAWEPILAKFQEQGITTLAIDMRGHGENLTGPKGEDLGAKIKNRDEDTFRAMHRDANAAIDWLVDNGYDASRIGLLGASVGCSVAIDTAVRREGLGPVGVLTPGLSYLGVDSEKHIESWGKRDLLIVTSEEESLDGPAPLRAALKMQWEARQAKSPGAKDRVDYWVLQGKNIHGTRMFGAVKGIEGRIATWFGERFGANSKATSRPSKR